MPGGGRVQVLAALVLVAGCAYAVRSSSPTAAYWSANRPVAGYYCYDCHGYRYFDPYYDWCPNYGFVYHWERSPQAGQIYRERYVALKSKDRSLGRVRYSTGYRATRRYREPVDFESWLRAKTEAGVNFKKSEPEHRAPDRGRKQRGPGDDDQTRPGRSPGPRPRRT